jgi:hypothetical protein
MKQPLSQNDSVTDKTAVSSSSVNQVQCKLAVGTANDQYEQEAEAVANNVMQMPQQNFLQRKCADCEEEKKEIQRKQISNHTSTKTQPKGETGASISNSLDNKINSSRGSGNSMDGKTQSFMQSQFGTDFSNVKIHTDGEAIQMNQELNAKAFTVGSDIYFNEGQYQPSSENGRRLLAHELTHTIQQDNGTVRRCIDPKKNDPWYDKIAAKIKTLPAYTSLVADDKKVADQIIVDAKKKAGCIYYIGKLQQLFETKEKAAGDVVKENKDFTDKAVKQEKTRVSKPEEAKNLDMEKKAADAVPAANWKKIKGKFGGGTYEVTNTDPLNIVVRVKIFLKPTGVATAADVNDIKSLQDGIEKAASRKGFIVSIQFVDKPDAETFTAEVNHEGWTVADHWSMASPRTLAHELFHMLAFEIDRYDYVETHSTNESMLVKDRLTWFAAQLTKPVGFDNDYSIMGLYGEHPLNDDICRIAGLDIPTCVAERRKGKL